MATLFPHTKIIRWRSRPHAFPTDVQVPAGRNRPSSDEQPHGWLSQRLCHEASAELPRMARGWTCRACHRARPRCACPGQYSEFAGDLLERSEEHTSELQSLMRISYAVFVLKKKKKKLTKKGDD